MGSAELLGRYAFALAVTAPVFMFANMRLRFLVATDVQSETSFSKYFRFRLASSSLATVFLGGAIAVAFRTPELFYAVLIMSATRAVESLSDLVYGLYQRSHRLHLMAISMVIAGITMIAAVALTLALDQPLEVVLLALLAARCVVFVLFDRVQWRRGWPEDPSGTAGVSRASGSLVGILRHCWPLGAVALLVSLNTNIPRYFVEFMLGAESLGIFAALAYVPIAGYMIVGTIGQTVMPDIARAYQAGDRRRLLRHAAAVCGFGAIAGLVAIAFGVSVGGRFLGLAYGSEYAVYSGLFVILLTAGAASYVVVGAVYVLTATRYFKSQLVLYTVDLVLVATLCYVWLPRFGLDGSGFAMLASQLVQIVIVVVLIGTMMRGLERARPAPVPEMQR